MSTRITFALILAAAVVPPGAAYAPITTLGEIFANPDRFDGQVVTIEGMVTNLRQRVSRLGDPYYKFDLSDGQRAIRVVSLGRPPCQSGAVMVEGTFDKMKIEGRALRKLKKRLGREGGPNKRGRLRPQARPPPSAIAGPGAA